MAKQNKPLGRLSGTKAMPPTVKTPPLPARTSERERKLAGLAALREKYKGLRASTDDVMREHADERQREERAG